MQDDIVRDSSIWKFADQYSAQNSRSYGVRLGVILSSQKSETTGQTEYIVAVTNEGENVPISCQLMTRFGGFLNYENYIYTGYEDTPQTSQTNQRNVKIGDTVVVTLLGGNPDEGLILGGIAHPARTPEIDPKEGPQYNFEYNGFNIQINAEGETEFVFKGQPTNRDTILGSKPGEPIPDPEYDEEVGTSSISFTKDGSIEISDNGKEVLQSIRIDKTSGLISIISDEDSIILTGKKGEGTLDITTGDITVKSKASWTLSTDAFTSTSKTTKINVDTIAIGKSGAELLDLFDQTLAQVDAVLIAVQAMTHPTAVGPTGPPINLPDFTKAQVEVSKIKATLGQIKGSL